MKKALIAILVIMTVFCSAAFADSKVENYTGFAIGYGISNARVEDMFTYKYNQVIFSITDFGFIDKSPVGLFIDGTLFVATKGKLITSIDEYDLDKDDLPVGLMATIGPAFKIDMGKNMDMLLGVGFQVYRQTWVDPYEKWQEFFYGVGADIEFAYELGKSFSLAIGANGSYFFANTRYYSNNYVKNVDVSYDKYWEYRIIPKIVGYYTF